MKRILIILTLALALGAMSQSLFASLHGTSQSTIYKNGGAGGGKGPNP